MNAYELGVLLEEKVNLKTKVNKKQFIDVQRVCNDHGIYWCDGEKRIPLKEFGALMLIEEGYDDDRRHCMFFADEESYGESENTEFTLEELWSKKITDIVLKELKAKNKKEKVI